MPGSAPARADEPSGLAVVRHAVTVHPYDPLHVHGSNALAERGARRTILGSDRCPHPDTSSQPTASFHPGAVDTGPCPVGGASLTPDSWRFGPDAEWLVGDYRYPLDVAAGSVIVVSEGQTIVGYVHVESVGHAQRILMPRSDRRCRRRRQDLEDAALGFWSDAPEPVEDYDRVLRRGARARSALPQPPQFRAAVVPCSTHAAGGNGRHPRPRIAATRRSMPCGDWW